MYKFERHNILSEMSIQNMLGTRNKIIVRLTLSKI